MDCLSKVAAFIHASLKFKIYVPAVVADKNALSIMNWLKFI